MNKPIDSISLESVARMRRHDWPGNVRELQNVLERTVILATGPEAWHHVAQMSVFRDDFALPGVA